MEKEYEENTSERHSLVVLIEVKFSSMCLILYALASERFVIVSIQMRSGILVFFACILYVFGQKLLDIQYRPM